MLVIEDGTGVANANSYISAEDIIKYAAARGVTIEPGEAVDVLAIKAMDYLAIQCFIGELAFPNVQYVSWPRRGLIDGDLAPNAVLTIPGPIREAQARLALDVNSGIDLVPSSAAEPKLKKRKTGPIEREFFEGGGYSPNLPMVTAILGPLLCGQGFRVRTFRA